MNKIKAFDRIDFEIALRKCGIFSGDTILVHSDLFLLGPINCDKDKILSTYFEAIFNVIGNNGTLVVPAYFYEYARHNKNYDIKNSPVSDELGVFSKYVASLENVYRSTNPVSALAAIGKKASLICESITGSAYGVDSPWDQLLKCNTKMIFIGVDLRAMTFIHYVEHMVGVPHIYNKYYTTPVTSSGSKVDLQICTQVRYLDYNISYDLLGLTKKFEDAGLVYSQNVGRGKIRTVDMRGAYEFLKTKLQQDFFYLLNNPPEFVECKLPIV